MAQQEMLREIRDHQEIKGLRAAYSHTIDRAIDSGSWDDFTALYTDDAVVDYPQATLRGPDEIETFGHDLEELYEYSMHTVQMPQIEVDGDEATGRWYMLVFYVAADGSEGHALGYYEDEYRRVDGEWRFARVKARVVEDTDGFHT